MLDRRLGTALVAAVWAFAVASAPASADREEAAAPAAAARLAVRVVDVEGRPVAGAVVEARHTPAERRRWNPFSTATPLERTWRSTPAGWDETVLASGATSAEGAIDLTLEENGEFDLTARAPGRAVRGAQVALPRAAGQSSPVSIVLDAGHTLSGVVCGPDGAPIADALVVAAFASLGNARRDDSERPLRTTTDARGAFRLDGLPAGAVTVHASPPGTWFDRRHVVRVPGERVDIVLPVRRLRAVVRDAESGTPLPGVPVLLEVSGFHRSDTYLRARTDDRGRIDALWPSSGVVGGQADSPGHFPRLHRGSDDVLDLDALDGKEGEFVLVPAATIRGVVRDPAGPVAGATVVARWLDEGDTEERQVRTGADGSFEVKAAPGRVHLAAALREQDTEVDDLQSLFDERKEDGPDLLTVTSKGQGGVVLSLRGSTDAACGRVQGRVVWDDGFPPTSVLVTLEGAAGAMRTDIAPDGSFLFLAVPPGEFTIRAEHLTTRSPGASVVARAGRTTHVADLELPCDRERRVAGQLDCAEGESPSGAWAVFAYDGRRFPVRADGSFEITTRATRRGTMAIVVGAPGRVPGRTTVGWPPEGDVVDVGRISFGTPQRFRVVAAETGEPLRDAAATLEVSRGYIACGPFEEPSDARRWAADDDGWIAIDEDLAPGERSTVWAIVSATGRVARRCEGSRLPEQVALPLPAVLAGRVRYADGRPARGVVLEASESPGSHSVGVLGRDATTDDEGRFRIDGLAPVPQRLRIESGSRDSVVREFRGDVSAPNAALDLVVVRAQTIEGLVVDVRGRPVPEARVSAKKAGEPYARISAMSDAHGAFRLAGVTDGRWAIQVSLDVLHDLANVADVLPGTRDLRLQIDRGHVLVGRTVDETGRPLAGRTVYLTQEQSEARPLRVRTGADGRFVADGLWGGGCKVGLGVWGELELEPATVDLPREKDAEVTFVRRRQPAPAEKQGPR